MASRWGRDHGRGGAASGSSRPCPPRSARGPWSVWGLARWNPAPWLARRVLGPRSALVDGELQSGVVGASRSTWRSVGAPLTDRCGDVGRSCLHGCNSPCLRAARCGFKLSKRHRRLAGALPAGLPHPTARVSQYFPLHRPHQVQALAPPSLSRAPDPTGRAGGREDPEGREKGPWGHPGPKLASRV